MKLGSTPSPAASQQTTNLISLLSTFHFGPDLEKLFPVEGGMEDGDMDAACREGDARDGDEDAEDIDEDAWWGWGQICGGYGRRVGNTILHEASTSHKLVQAAKELLIKASELLNICNNFDVTPPYRSVEFGRMDMFKFLDDLIRRQKQTTDQEGDLESDPELSLSPYESRIPVPLVDKEVGMAIESSSDSSYRVPKEMIYLDDVEEFKSTMRKDGNGQDQQLFLFKSLVHFETDRVEDVFDESSA
ncbi:hypothetical protein RHSIM_Rhsim06G0147900 [Rhododendron simsii]|uniref:Uncharacterized protein n=1 Tax=Rhododendron simsii TaxID=118357 RepID=A0A834LM11_RHOSS|nr:hypothetical protein RHSIM_Rhsim06G0147900 [Rhododendron simsii]